MEIEIIRDILTFAYLTHCVYYDFNIIIKKKKCIRRFGPFVYHTACYHATVCVHKPASRDQQMKPEEWLRVWRGQRNLWNLATVWKDKN